MGMILLRVGLASYANLVTGEPSTKNINLHTLLAPAGNGADVAILLVSVRAFRECFANFTYGFYLRKHVAYLVVENYVKNTWRKYGHVKSMMNSSNGLFFFKFSSKDGLDAMLENGPWFIRSFLLILRKLNPDANLLKVNVCNVSGWVKFHGVPITAFSEDGLSATTTKLSTPLMLDSTASTMCMKSWDREPIAGIFLYNGNFDLVFQRRSEYCLVNTPQLIKIQNLIKVDSKYAQLVYDELIYEVDSMPDFVQAKEIVEKNLDGNGTGSGNESRNGGNGDGDLENVRQMCPNSASDGGVAYPLISTPNPVGNEINVVVPVESIRAITERFANTAYGFFLGKRVAYPVVANYVRNTWVNMACLWFIRSNPLILKKWHPDVNLLKEDVGNVPIWVKLHGVPVMAFSEDGLSAIATKLGTSLMFDSYTSDMCMQSWGRSSYARAMIELRANVDLKDNIVVVMSKITGEGFYTCNIHVEYE
ncbi:beta-caryophyllene synthase [Tanacetum coccineum]|uniref:Beta-caryophyllene synthase n=1 Tax=Tanacetum coccineum TaxID=301880 RepID=A0ABQ5D178_9ASTR